MTGGSGSLFPRRAFTGAVVLTLVFAVLRVTGVTAWPWWAVLSPVLAGAAAGAGVLFVLGVAWAARRWA